MAVQMLDGFELYGTLADMALNGWSSWNTPEISTTVYRTGARGIYCHTYAGGNYSSYITSPILAGAATVIVGIGFRVSAIPAIDTAYPLIYFQNAGTTHVKIFMNSGYMEARNNGNGLLGSSSPYGFSAGIWHQVEIKIYVHDTAGTVEIRVNGDPTPILNLTGLDTRNGATTTINRMIFRSSRYYAAYFDDFYFLDTTGAAPYNTWLGDCGVYPIRVTGAGNYSQFTPSAGNNEDNVDESPGPDGDTTYNDGDALNEIDTYAMSDLPSVVGTILGLKHQMTVKKTDTGTTGITPVLRINGSDYLGTESILGTSYVTKSEIWMLNPDDSAAFEKADIDAIEMGAKVTTIP